MSNKKLNLKRKTLNSVPQVTTTIKTNMTTNAETRMEAVRHAMYMACTMNKEPLSASSFFSQMGMTNGNMAIPIEAFEEANAIDFKVMMMMGLLSMQSNFMTFQEVYDLCGNWLSGAVDKAKEKPQEVKCANDAKESTLFTFDAFGKEFVEAYKRGLEILAGPPPSRKERRKVQKSKKHRK